MYVYRNIILLAIALKNHSEPQGILLKCFNFFSRLCGPKMSLFGLCLSIWGIIQLSLMSLALYSRNVTFIEDLDWLNETMPDYLNVTAQLDNLEYAYDVGSFNCMIAAILYGVTLLISGHQYWLNTRSVRTNRYQRHY